MQDSQTSPQLAPDLEILRTSTEWTIRTLSSRGRQLMNSVIGEKAINCSLANALALKARQIGLRTHYHGPGGDLVVL